MKLDPFTYIYAGVLVLITIGLVLLWSVDKTVLRYAAVCMAAPIYLLYGALIAAGIRLSKK